MGAVNDVLFIQSTILISYESALQLSAWIDKGQNRNVHEEFIAALFEGLNACFKDQIHLRLKKKVCEVILSIANIS